MMLQAVSHQQSFRPAVQNVVAEEVVEDQLQLELDNQTVIIVQLAFFDLRAAHEAQVPGLVTDLTLLEQLNGHKLVQPALLALEVQNQ